MHVVAQQKRAYVVSNAHFDSQWNWTVQKSIESYIPSTMTQNIWLIENFPNYNFNFEGAVKYSWMKEYYPDLYAKVKEYVKLGRWNIAGSSWDANDPNIPSSESFFRNILIGQRFYREEFGKECNDIMLPDCFGFGYALPTEAAHAGLKGFTTQKLQWRTNPFFGDKKIPFRIGRWRGIDGNEIMAVMDAGGYTTSWREGEDLSRSARLDKLADETPGAIAYHYYGTGDTGGSPNIRSAAVVSKSVDSDGPIKIISSSVGQIFDEFYPVKNHDEFPVYDGELLMDVHATGCYTSQTAMKKFNRRNEQLADAAERISSVADWAGVIDYPSSEILTCWKRFLWHQFHDDLTGTSIPAVYPFSWNDEIITHTQFEGLIQNAVAGIASQMDTRGKGNTILVYNPSSFDRKDIVEFYVPDDVMTSLSKTQLLFNAPLSAVSPDGKIYPVQLTSSDSLGHKAIFVANVKPLSLTVFELKPWNPSRQSSSLKVSKGEKMIENNVYKVTLDKNGDISSMIDKRFGREMVQEGKAFRLALFTENVSEQWPSWEIQKKTIDSDPVAVSDSVTISIAENGPVRSSLKVERFFKGSHYVQYVSLSNGANEDLLIIRNEIDWRTKNALLKAEFHTSVDAPKASYDLGIGNIQRGNNVLTSYEVYAHQWADLSSSDYGISITNDCKYGWDKPDNSTLRLSLIHTPLSKSVKYQTTQDMGHNIFSYAVRGHAGGVAAESGVIEAASSFNQPLKAYLCEEKHPGVFGKRFSAMNVSTSQIAVKAFKKAEDGDGYVIRVNEMWGKSVDGVQISFPAEVISAEKLNAVEDKLSDAEINDGKLIVSLTKFSPATYRVRLKSPDLVPDRIISQPIELRMNRIAITNDAFNRRGSFDRRGNSYAAELIPDTLEFEGVIFRLINDPAVNNAFVSWAPMRFRNGQRPPQANSNPPANNNPPANASKTTTNQQANRPAPGSGPQGFRMPSREIEIPEGEFDHIELLVAACDSDRIVTFKADSAEFKVNVPYFTGFYGSWGRTGYSKSYVKNGRIAYVGTHSHSADKGNNPYVFTYMYRICLPACRKIELPEVNGIAVFAATAVRKSHKVSPLFNTNPEL